MCHATKSPGVFTPVTIAHNSYTSVYIPCNQIRALLQQSLELEHALFLGNHLPINFLKRPRKTVKNQITSMIELFSLAKITNINTFCVHS